MSLKNWTDGDVFYGADMDDFTRNSIMRFANTAARTSTLVGQLAPAPGMLAVAQDTNLTERYVDFAGTRYWIPHAGMILVQTGGITTGQGGPSQVIANTTVTPLTCLAVTGFRNVNNWFTAATGVFQPTIPGYYEFTAGGTLGSDTSATGVRCLGVRLNGASTMLLGGGGAHSGGGASRPFSTLYILMRPCVQYLNGGSDYIEVCAYQSSGGSATFQGSTNDPAFFSVKYLGR